jgi:hypothetical protein
MIVVGEIRPADRAARRPPLTGISQTICEIWAGCMPNMGRNLRKPQTESAKTASDIRRMYGSRASRRGGVWKHLEAAKSAEIAFF